MTNWLRGPLHRPYTLTIRMREAYDLSGDRAAGTSTRETRWTPADNLCYRYVRGFVRARPSVARFQTQLSLFIELEVEKKRIIWILGTFWIIEIRKELGFSFFFFFDAWYWIESVDGISFRRE